MKRSMMYGIAVLSLSVVLTGCAMNQTHEEMINDAIDNLAKAKDTLAKVEKSAIKISDAVAKNAPIASEFAEKMGADSALIDKINAAGADAASVSIALQKTKEAMTDVPVDTDVVEEAESESQPLKE